MNETEDTVILPRQTYEGVLLSLHQMAQDASLAAAVEHLFQLLGEAAGHGAFEALNPAFHSLGALINGWNSHMHSEIERVHDRLRDNARTPDGARVPSPREA